MIKFKSYFAVVSLFPIFLALYGIVGIAPFSYAKSALRGVEIFPFFSWSLFSKPTKIITRYTLVFTDFDCSENPILDRGCGRVIDAKNTPLKGNISFSKVVGKFGFEFESLDAAKPQFRKSKILVENFLRPYKIREYSLVRERLNLLEVSSAKRVVERKILADFEVENEK